MIPFVLNDDLTRLVQINMSGSVGKGGKNLAADVKLVQSMLNNAPLQDGGPPAPLKADGLAGPLTIGAITRFQRASRLAIADGRIDPGRSTITALGRLLNQRGRIPQNVAGIGAPDDRVVRALTGVSNAPRGVRGNLAANNGFRPLGPTDWQFATSSSLGVGVDIFGVTAMRFHMVKDSRPGFTRIFPYGGFGVGLSAMPVTLDISFADMPSFGLRVRQGPFGGANPMPEDDFTGPCTVLSIGASVGVGFAGTLCLFGAAGPILATANAIAAIAGMEVGLPGASITGFFGITNRAIN